MKKELKKPIKENSVLKVRAYDGEACVNGNNNKDVNVSGGTCDFTDIICFGIDLFCWL